MAENNQEGLGKMWVWGKDILVLLVVPVFIWTIKLEVENAQRDMLITQSDVEIVRLEERISEMKDIDARVQQNALQLARLEGKVDTANGRLDEIRNLLLRK